HQNHGLFMHDARCRRLMRTIPGAPPAGVLRTSRFAPGKTVKSCRPDQFFLCPSIPDYSRKNFNAESQRRGV
ncbi:MAG: hypothetical protein OEY07_08995, partial [Gammaproteobacteria bacterium]|nr:hypothetical protein [Gammaproteobacteria bacterium]